LLLLLLFAKYKMEGESILPCKNLLNHMLMRPSEDTKEIEGTTWGVGSIEMFKILSHQFEFLERIKIKLLYFIINNEIKQLLIH
jgi:hypothetical protein